MRFLAATRLLSAGPCRPGPPVRPSNQVVDGAALCAITLAAYANSFGMGLALDAPLIISKDPRMRAATAENLSLILHQDYWWPSFISGLYRPVTTASFLLELRDPGKR